MSDNGEGSRLKILTVATEITPFAKVSGLADVAASLPLELDELGHDVRIAMPLYRSIDAAALGLKVLFPTMAVPMGGRTNNVSVLEGSLDGGKVPVYFIRNDFYFGRERMYDFDDDDERSIIFCRAVLELLPRLDWFPDVIHCHDWHTGIIPNWLGTIYRDDARYANIASVFTIHNLAYQGVYSPATLRMAHLDDRGLLYPQLTPFKAKVNLLGRGVLFADVINTPSERYSREILTPEFGEELDPLLRERKDRLFGMLNGIDMELFDPASDPYLEQKYSADALEGRAANKAALQREVGLPEGDAPLIGVVSRMIEQKGFDILFPALDQLLTRHDAQVVLLGSGDIKYADSAEELARKYPDKMKAVIDFSTPLAQRIYGGADIFVMPSHFEAGGLSQMIAMRYGAIPVVRDTGGLADTVRDYKPGSPDGNGFVFGPYTTHALYRGMVRAIEAYRDQDAWCELIRRDMAQDFSWTGSARKYVDLYHKAMQLHAEEPHV